MQLVGHRAVEHIRPASASTYTTAPETTIAKVLVATSRQNDSSLIQSPSQRRRSFSVCVTVTVRIPLLPEFVDANTATGQFVVERDRYVDA